MNETDTRLDEMVRIAREYREADNAFVAQHSEQDRVIALMKEDLAKLQESNG